MIKAWFDGCCEPRNPGGHAAFGAVIKKDGRQILRMSQYVGCGDGISNNVAEYAGVIAILEEVAKHPKESVLIHGDSKLVVEQLSFRWRARGGAYLPYYKKAVSLLMPMRARIKFQWISRDFNDECDELSKEVLRDMGVRFRIQPEPRLGAIS